MTAGLAILLVGFGVTLGWIGHQFEQTALVERWAEKPAHGEPRSHCRLVTPPFDQDQDPTGAVHPGGGGDPDGTVTNSTAASGAARGPGGGMSTASRAAPHPTRPDR